MKNYFYTLCIFAFIIFAFVYSCGEEKKQISESGLYSLAMDSARANDTLLMKLQKDTNQN